MEITQVGFLKGRCACGAVEFEVRGPLGPLVYCHCSICRRTSGSAFAANASVRATAFTINRGGDAIREFESSEGYFRAFCPRCGSPIYGRSARSPDIRRVRLGTLVEAPAVHAAAHVWTDSRAPWFEPADGLQRFPGMPPRNYIAPG